MFAILSILFPLFAVSYSVTNQCVDLLNPSTGVSDCPNVKNLCNNTIYYSLMTVQCPATCGRCNATTGNAGTTTTTTNCTDKLNPATNKSDCPAVSYLCNNGAYYNLMTVQCPLTCGRCNVAVANTATTVATGTASGNCTDLLNPSTGKSDCPAVSYLCNNAAYTNLMTVQCPKTCGRCTSG